MSTESRELVLHAENNARLWNNRRPEFVKNLIRKKMRGQYDSAKAVKLWEYFANEAAESYAREYKTGGPHGKYGIFSKADRVAAAREFAKGFESEWKHERQYLERQYPALFKVKATKKKTAKKKATRRAAPTKSQPSESEQAAALRRTLRGL